MLHDLRSTLLFAASLLLICCFLLEASYRRTSLISAESAGALPGRPGDIFKCAPDQTSTTNKPIHSLTSPFDHTCSLVVRTFSQTSTAPPEASSASTTCLVTAMDHSAAPVPYTYGQPGAYHPYPYPYPPASAAWPPGFDPAMLPYPDPRLYAGGVPGYFDHLTGRPPPSAADFYAAAAAVSLLLPIQCPTRPHAKCSKSRTLSTSKPQDRPKVHSDRLCANVQPPYTSNLPKLLMPAS